MESLALLLSGFSVFSALVISVTHFSSQHYKDQLTARFTGILLMAALAGLQWFHFAYLHNIVLTLDQAFYHLLLFVIAPAFYLFSKPLLTAANPFNRWQLLHFVPSLIALSLPHKLALPVAFIIGAAYLLWLGRTIYALREQRSRFRTELSILGIVFIIALSVMLLGLFMPLVPERLFFALYASAIGFAFILVSIALSYAPQLTQDVSEAAQETYAVSTLGQVDCDAIITQLEQLMQQDELYRDSQLDLTGLAQRLDLSSHQLSELINTRLGKHFSRYMREYRVGAAQKMLLKERSASVLSVGLSVGFTSQSNFYDAFREITGTTPGKYRKLQQKKT
ncbi:MAG: helix-turn-helix domain-containing protein [Thiolinea sp.]